MRSYQRLVALVFAAALLGSPARATGVYEYAKDENVVIDNGMAPNGQLSLAAHGEGEFGSDHFYIYLMAEPRHRRMAALDGITDNLDSSPNSFHAQWSPDSRHVAVTFRTERHVSITMLYGIERNRAVHIKSTSLFKEVTSRDVNEATDHQNNRFTNLTWLSPRRFVLREDRLFVDAVPTLLRALGRFGRKENEEVYEKRVFFKFSAEAIWELVGRNRYRIVELRPGGFEH